MPFRFAAVTSFWRKFTRWCREEAWRGSPVQLWEKWEEHRFDRRHGTETCSYVSLRGLTIASANSTFGERYQPSPVASLRKVLRSLNISFGDYSFVDFGSGKGRTLIIASEWPFRQVLGVEFSAELNEMAAANLSKAGTRRALRVATLHCDATSFELPRGPLLLYFFQPFSDPVLARVLDNIVASLRADPRPTLIVYLWGGELPLLSKVPGLKLIRRWRKYKIYAFDLVKLGNAG